MPGRSYLELLRGDRADAWRDAYLGEYGNARVIRTVTRKLIRRAPGPNGHFPDELYDLERDPRERQNVIGQARYGEDVEGLSTRLKEHFARYEVPGRSGWRIASQPDCNGGSEPWLKVPNK